MLKFLKTQYYAYTLNPDNSLYFQLPSYYPTPKSSISTCQRLPLVALLANTGTVVGTVPGMKLSLPKDPSVFIAFMSEIFLSTMILLILLVATVELRRGRAPKVIAIECWRISCSTLIATATICAALC